MADLSTVGEELFNKIRSRFPRVKAGDEDGKVTNIPSETRFYDITYTDSGDELGKISISLTEENGVTVIYSKDLVGDRDGRIQQNWYSFLRELRVFAKKRMLKFDVRNINKNSLSKRDYAQLSRNSNMKESRMYGKNRTSYQDMGGSRLVIRHTESIDPDHPRGRSRKIESIFIESSEGERFKYPYRSLKGARAMARHVAEGGNPYDNFGEYIVGLTEESNKLRKFKNYVGRSKVMAESLSEYSEIVENRIKDIRKTLESLQKSAHYRATFEDFQPRVFEDVPTDVRENWIDQLTIRQFNEELEDVFPYVYRLVGESNRVKEVGPDELLADEEDEEHLAEAAQLDPEAVNQLANMPLDQAKASAEEMIQNSSLKDRKKEYFAMKIQQINSTMKLVKLMYDLILSGEGMGVVGSRGSMQKNTYRQKFEDSVDYSAVSEMVLKGFQKGKFTEGLLDQVKEHHGEQSVSVAERFMKEVTDLYAAKSKPTGELTESVDQRLLKLSGLL